MKKKVIDILKLVLIGIVLELILFNITTFISLFRQGEKITINIDENFSFLYTENEDEIIIPITDINKKINTIKIEQTENPKITNLEYKIGYSDETSKEIRWMQNSKHLITGNERTKYISTYLSGDVNTIWILTDRFSVETGDIKNISFNETIPITFNVLRFLIVTGIIIFIYAVKNSEKNYNPKSLKQETILIIVVLFAIAICNTINGLTDCKELDFYSKDFLEAIKNGKVYLLRDDSEKLSTLEDPYDTLTRDINIQRDTEYLWDVAYYNGNYYVYFGIIPLLTLFLPFNLITHKYLTSSMAVLIYSVLVFILLKEVLFKVVNKYFKNISFKVVISSLAILCFGSLILFLNGIPRYYEVAVISGLFFTLLGLYFILEFAEQNKAKYRYVFLGSLCLALAVGCRPTYLLVSLIILPLLIKTLISNIKNKDKKEILKEILSVGIPYITVGIALMYYNYIRFGSIFEFGARYQLTINNMNKIASREFTIIQGLWCNLFSLPSFVGEFPYIGNHNDFNFNGYYYIENMIGGLFILAPVCFFNFYILKNFKNKENKERNIMILIIFLVGILIAALSVAMAGSNQRYIVDYGWLIILSGIFTFFSIYLSLKSDEAKKILEKIIAIIAVYTIIINIAAGIVSEKSYIKNNSNKEFYEMKYTVCFWE